MAVTLTEAAAKHVQKFLTRRGKGVGLRLGVKTSGCSGMAYKLEFADEVNSDDQVWESFGVKVIVDEKSLKRRCMSCCHRSRLRLPNRQLIEHMRPDRRDVARPHGNDEVAGFSERGHGRGNVNPARNVMRLGVAGMI